MKLTAEERTPTAGMVAAAERALGWHKAGRRGGTLVGLNRARQIARRQPLSEDVIKRMHSFFARHEVDKTAPGFHDTDKPSPGRVAWDLWGGDDGKTWSDKLAAKLKEK